MGIRRVIGAIAGIAAIVATTAASASPATVRFVTEDYAPFNFRENGELRGAAVEQVRRIAADLGLDYTMELMPWARALGLAESQPMHCVFTTAHNEERHARFKWVEPLLVDYTVLMARAGSGVAPASIEAAREFTVGTQRNDFTHVMLEDLGFPRIDIATDLELTLKKLLSGRIDLMPVSRKYYDRLKRNGEGVEEVLVLSERTYGIACHTSVPDDLVAAMQAKLDALIADGTQAQLYRAYGLDSDD